MIETYKVPVSPDQIRRQIIAWHEYRDLGKLPEDCFRKPVAADGVPDGVAWILCHEGRGLYGVMHAFTDGWVDDYNSFEEMLQAHGYWYENMTSVTLYLYPNDVDWF